MSICDVPPKKIWVTFTHFWGGLGSFLPRLGRFAEYVVRRGKCGSNGESICLEGELSFRGICGLPRKMCHIFWRGALWQTVGEEFLNHHYVFILRDNVRKIIMKKKHR